MKSSWVILSLVSAMSKVCAEGLDRCSQRLDSSCTVNTIETPSQNFQCGKKGVVRTPYQTRSGSCLAPSLNTCRDSCLADAGCTTFGYDAQTQTCHFYSQPLRSMHFKPTPNNPFAEIHYHRHCFDMRCDLPPQPVPEDSNLILNGGFEEQDDVAQPHTDLKRSTETQQPIASHWRNLNASPFGGCVPGNTAKEGMWSMFCRPQRENFGIVQDVAGFEVGEAYVVEAQMAFLAGRDTAAKCAFYLDEKPQGVLSEPVIDIFPCKGGWCGDDVVWHAVRGEWIAEKRATSLRIDCIADASLSYLVDEVSIVRK